MHEPTSNGRLACVAAGWHGELVDQQVDELERRLGASGWTMETFRVPGAFEIPLHAQRLARHLRVKGAELADAVVATVTGLARLPVG